MIDSQIPKTQIKAMVVIVGGFFQYLDPDKTPKVQKK